MTRIQAGNIGKKPGKVSDEDIRLYVAAFVFQMAHAPYADRFSVKKLALYASAEMRVDEEDVIAAINEAARVKHKTRREYLCDVWDAMF